MLCCVASAVFFFVFLSSVMLTFGVVWCGAVRPGAVRCGVLWCAVGVDFAVAVVCLSLFLFGISLGDIRNCANSVGFWVSVPLFPHFCQLSVLEVGVCGVYLESP